MKAIITRPNSDGTYDAVGMNNRLLTSRYKTEKGLFKYGISSHFKGLLRIELFDNIYKDPIKITYFRN